MKKILLGLLLALSALPAFAQSTYPTVSGQRVNGVVPLTCDTNGINCAPTSASTTQGPVASGATASGNPVPFGCDYNGTRPTVTTGQRVTVQCTSRGLPTIAIGDSGAAAVVGVSSNTGDTVGTGSIALLVQSLNYAFDGTAFARVRGDAAGGLVVQPGLAATHWNYAAASGGISNTSTAVTVKAAAGAGIRNCITSIQLYASALGAATEIAIRDGAAGTVIWRGFVGTGGISMSSSQPTPLCGTANTLLEVVTLTATVTGGVYFNAQGFTRT